MSCQQKSRSMNWLFQLFQIKVNIAGLSVSAWRHGKVSAQGYFGNVNLPAQRRYNTEIFQYHGHGYVTVALLKTKRRFITSAETSPCKNVNGI